ncbi:MAG: MFS transporter [Aquiluna sp.]|nr:MFS transporter [Aquiluna sp.]MCF8545314.1 MFS transporter [Aquiluna sp.]
MANPQFRKRQLAMPIYLPSFLFTAAEGLLLPILPVSAVNYGQGLASAAIVTTLLMIGTFVFEIPAAWIVNKIGERRSMILASVMGFGLTSLAFISTSYEVLLVAAFGFGTAHSLFGLSRHSLLAEIVPANHRPKSMSLLGGMFRGGTAVGPVIGAGVIALFGLDAAYLAAGAICLLAGFAVLSTPAKKLLSSPSGLDGNILKVARRESKKLLTLGVASAIISAGRTIRLIGLPLLAIQLGIDAATASFIFGITGFIDFALFYLSGILMDRYGKFWSSVPTLIALGTIYLFSFAVQDLFTFWLMAAISALANAASAGINMILGADLAPQGSRNEFLAAFRMLTSGGVVVAPAMISGLTAVAGLSSALALTGLLNFYGAFLFWKYLPIYAPDKKR